MTTPVGPYSPIMKGGNFLFTAGQIGIKDGALVEGGVEAQTRQVFANLRTLLASADATLKDVLKVTVFLTDINDYAKVNRIYAQEFAEAGDVSGQLPARSAVAVVALPLGAAVEIEVVATDPLSRES